MNFEEPWWPCPDCGYEDQSGVQWSKADVSWDRDENGKAIRYRYSMRWDRPKCGQHGQMVYAARE